MRTGFIGKIPAFQFWWKRRVPLGISFAVTATALGIYWTTFVGERPTPAFDFIHRLELASLDARFQLRGPALPDPRIVIVDIDQRSQEILGRWPFPRSHFAKLIEVLRASGARVVTFDITFSQMDESARPIHEMRLRLAEQQQKGVPLDPRLSDEFNRLEKEFAYDQRFAEAIQRFGKVVLGNFFLYTQADLRGLDAATLGRYAELLAYYPFPQVRATSTAQGPQSFVNLINNFESLDLLPRGAEANLHILTAALPAHTSATGFFNIFPDPDGVVRRALLALPYGRSARRSEWDLYASIDVQTVRFFLDLPDREVVLNYGKTGIESFQLGSSLSVIPDDLGRVIINYQGPVRTYPYRSLVDVINKGLPPSTFEGKIVLVGASATGIGDIRPTPYRGMGLPGVEVHANIIDNILNRKFLERGARQVIVDHALILLFGLPLGLWLAVVRPRWMPLALLLLLPFGFGIYFAFARGWWLNAVTPSALALIPNTGLVALYRVLVEEREKRRVRGAFQQYLSPEVIRRLLENPELVRPRKLEITLLFNDIRGFTSVSEQLDAEEVAALLNGYLTTMTRIVFRHRGTLDKYMGDALMAFWGAPFEEPGHAEKACNAALAMLAGLDALRHHWQAQGKPLLDIGLGIHTGTAAVGNMGSALRYGYTALGDAVNLASRLERLNKVYGTHILASESSYRAAPSDRFLFRELDLIRVEGKLQPVTIYELLGSSDTPDQMRERAEVFRLGREFYKRRDWQQARSCFQQLLARWADDGPARVFLARCEEYLLEQPAPDWDGVYVFRQK